jgi:hypothetical protein
VGQGASHKTAGRPNRQNCQAKRHKARYKNSGMYILIAIGLLLALAVIWWLLLRAVIKDPNLDHGGKPTDTSGG